MSPAEAVRHQVEDDEVYVVGDAVEQLRQYDNEAAAIALDDAWARPQRREQQSVSYDLHPFDRTQSVEGERTTDARTTTEVVDACYDALAPGGWLIADVDDWLLPRMVAYLRAEWGDAAAVPADGGYRSVGGVTYLDRDGQPDHDTHGTQLSTGGYAVVFAHKGPTTRETAVSARQTARWPTETYGRGGRAKPVAPYEAWLGGLLAPGELLLVPCAGTAPAALAARRAFGDEARYVCVDTDPDAYQGFKTRYDDDRAADGVP